MGPRRPNRAGSDVRIRLTARNMVNMEEGRFMEEGRHFKEGRNKEESINLKVSKN